MSKRRIRLDRDFRTKSNAVQARIRLSRQSHVYNVSFTGEEFELLQTATMLNRRMLDRSPEHDILDRAFILVIEKLVKHWNELPEARALDREWQEILAAERQELTKRSTR